MEAVAIKADSSALQKKIEWMSALLKSGEVFERLDQSLVDRIRSLLHDGVGQDEVTKLGRVTAGGAGELIINVEAGPILIELESALRALGFEFHESSLSC